MPHQPPDLFCPDCGAYMGPRLLDCPNCTYNRPVSDCPPPGQPMMECNLGLPVTGLAALESGGWLAALGRYASETQPAQGRLNWLNPYGQPEGEGLSFQRPVLGEILLLPGKAAVLLGGRDRQAGGAVALVDPEKRTLCWGPVDLPGALKGLKFDNNRLWTGCADGQLYSLDPLNGRVLSSLRYLPVDQVIVPPAAFFSIRQGWVVATPKFQGQVLLLGNATLRCLAEFPNMITSAALAGSQELVVAFQDGSLVLVDLGNGAKRLLAKARKAGSVPPLVANGVVYFGSPDHSVQAIEISSGKNLWPRPFECEGGISTALTLAEGILYAGDSHGVVYGLNALAGDEIGRFRLPGPVRLLTAEPTGAPPPQRSVTSLRYTNGRVVIGGLQGGLACLPWHLGQYEWAAGRANEAAEYWAVQSEYTQLPDKKQTLQERAVTDWKNRGQARRLAPYFEALGRREDAAEAYEEASKALRTLEPSQAGDYLLRALRLWNDEFWVRGQAGDLKAKDRIDAVTENLSSIPSLRIPLLRTRLVNAPKFIERVVGEFTIEVRNLGKLAAHHLRITVGGGLAQTVVLPRPNDAPFEPHLPDHERHYNFKVQPTGSDPLRIDLDYADFHGRARFRTTLVVPIEISPALLVLAENINKLEVNGHVVVQAVDVGAVIQHGGGQNSVHADGMIGLVSTGEAAVRRCGVCNAPVTPGLKFCTGCGASSF